MHFPFAINITFKLKQYYLLKKYYKCLYYKIMPNLLACVYVCVIFITGAFRLKYKKIQSTVINLLIALLAYDILFGYAFSIYLKMKIILK